LKEYSCKCASPDSNWFRFKDHRWRKVDESELVAFINKKTAFYIRNIKKCAHHFYDPQFLEKLDADKKLICFENGVYDLDDDFFRNGKPDDYISLCTGYNYVEYNEEGEYDENNENDKNVQEIDDFMKRIMTGEVMRNYLLKLLSTCLDGSNEEENFYIFAGPGANGKSTLMKLLKYTLGGYAKSIDVRLLTEIRSSAEIYLEMADKQGIRMCDFDEPYATDEFDINFMKLFTGGDTIAAHTLFKEPVYFKPQFKSFLLCNRLPSIKSDNDGTWRRIKVIPFMSVFIQKDPAERLEKQETYFWADDLTSTKLQEWKQAFMCILLKYYRKYKKNGLTHPRLVVNETKKYREQTVIESFVSERLQKTYKPTDYISLDNLQEMINSKSSQTTIKTLREYLKNKMSVHYDSINDLLTWHKVKRT